MQTKSKISKNEKGTPPDLTLLLAKMEDAVIRGEDFTKCRLIVARESLWKGAKASLVFFFHQ